ncbi:MAG: alpha-galactosidase [Candidatus Lokiarchaeota archaeon]|nr:alpha-galactosidase [Candidatus Lokiarchaeota archaeon]
MNSASPVTLETKERSVILSNGLTKVEFSLESSTYTVTNLETGCIAIDGAGFAFLLDVEDAERNFRRVTLASKDFTCIHHELDPAPISRGLPGAKTGRFMLDAPKARYSAVLEIELAPGKVEVILRVSIKNNNTFSAHAVSIAPLVAGPGACKALGAPTGDERVFYNGYQSWSLARAFTSREKQWHAAVQVAEYPHHYHYMSGPAWLARKAGRQVSNSVTVITQPASKQSITIGFITAVAAHGEVEVAGTTKRGIIEVRASSWCEGKVLHPGSHLASELLFIQERNQYPRCLDGYADAVARNMAPVSWSHVPFGYCTWYYYYSNIDEKESIKNLDIVTDPRKNPYFKIDYFQLDDGYQFTRGQCGDWRRVNPEKFPGGFARIVDAITAKHIVPGLWIAPFNALPDSDLAKAHPDWILKTVKGTPIKPTFISGKFQYALDLTHPGVKSYLKDLFTFLAKDIGFKYIKIDFVFSAITEDAVFYNNEVTRVEAYRDALKILRDATGDDVFILGCGAPLLESTGFVNGMRISADTDPRWTRINALLEPLGVLVPGMRWALLNTITRSWMHKKLWINDPDCLMVRNTRTKLTEDEIQTELSVIGLSGGQVAVSDDLALLPPERMRLVALVQPPCPEPAHSPDMFVRPFPELYMVSGSSVTHGDWTVVTVINWQDRARDMLLDLQSIGCSTSRKYHVTDFWNNTYIGSFTGNEAVPLPRVARHGCRLLRITGDAMQRAVLLGTTLHVLQGALEVETLEFDCAGKRFHLRLSKHGRNEGTVHVKMPGRCLFESASGAGYEINDVAEGVYAVRVSFDDSLDIVLKVELA